MNSRELSLLLALMAGVSFADDTDKVAHWVAPSGNSYRDWMVADSWDIKSIPGRYSNGTLGEKGWTVYFDGGKDWVTTIPDSFYSVSNVVVAKGTSITKLCNSQWNTLYLEPGGLFLLDDSYGANFAVNAPIGIQEMTTTEDRIHIRNDVAGKTLTLMCSFGSFKFAPGFSSFCYPHVSLEGCGTIKLNGSFPGNSNFRPYLDLAMDEGGQVQISNTGSFSNLQTLYVPSGRAAQTLQIDDGAVFSTGSDPKACQIDAYSSLTVTGDGLFKLNSTGTDAFRVAAGATLDLRAKMTNAQSSATYAAVGRSGGLLRFSGENTIPGSLVIRGGLTVESATIGRAGEVSNIGSGSYVNFSGTGSTFKYVGEGETTDRDVIVDSSSNVSFEQAGTGPLEITGDVQAYYLGRLNLVNDTIYPATLSGTVLDKSSNGSQPDVYKCGAGEWVIAGTNAVVASNRRPRFHVQQGTLTLGNKDATCIFSAEGPGVTLKVADGIATSLQLTRVAANEGSVDVVLGEDASLRLSNMASGRTPDWLTLNGEPARIDSNG